MGQPGTGTGGFAAPPSAAATPAVTSNDGRAGTGTGGFAAPPPPGSVPAAAPTGSHGFFGSLEHDLGGAAHWVAAKSGKAASDIKSMGTGLYGLGKLEGKAFAYDTHQLIHHPLQTESLHEALYGKPGSARADVYQGAIKGTAKSYEQVFKHPLRDPFLTAVNLYPLVGGAARLGLEGADASAALRGLDTPSLLKTPRLVNEPGREPVSLYSSHNAARRLVQSGVDKAVNRALANDSAKGLLGHEGPVASYGRYRMGGTLAERARAGIRYHQALIANTRVAGRAVTQFSKSIKGEVADPQLTAQAILHSLHDNVLPEHEAILHEIQAQRGVNPEQNLAWAQAFNDAHNLGVVHLSEDNRVAVNTEHPLAEPLAKADKALEDLGTYADNQLVSRGLREPASLEGRKARVGQLVQRAKPLLDEEPQALREARRSVEKAAATHERNLQAEEKFRAGSGAKTVDGYPAAPGPHLTPSGKSVKGEVNNVASNPQRNKILLSGQKLEDAQARVRSLEDRYGLNSPERRTSIEQGIHGREQVAEAAHRLFGDQAPQHLARIEGFARHYARTNDVTPHEFYSQFLNPGGTPEGLLSEYRALEQKVTKAERRVEKAHGPADLANNPVDYENWQEWSRRRGYTEAEIADFQRWLDLNKHLGITEPEMPATPTSPFGMSDQGILEHAHAVHATVLNGVIDSMRKSLAPGVAEIARRMYAPKGWDHASEAKFVEDMTRAANGEAVAPEVQRLFTMTHDYIPGRGYVPMTVWEDAVGKNSPMASSVAPIVGEAKSPINSHFATGEATAQGMRRTDVTESVTAHVQKLFRFFNTLDHRELAASHGSDTRLSTDDVLMRYDRRTPAGMKLPAQNVSAALKETLGILENRTGLPEPEQEGLAAGVSEALKDAVGHLFPRYGTDNELRRMDATAERGAKAPAGYVWVPKQLARLKDLEAATTRGEAGRIGRFMDNVNGAITAATVYFKVGHIFTRVLTNAATNIMQDSARPTEIALSVKLSHELSDVEMKQALSYAGTHYHEAAPGATGSTVVARGMAKGLHVPFTDKALRMKSGEAVMSPQWWAHHVDAPFRFNSIAYEARKAGYEGADGFRQFLHDVEDYNLLDAHAKASVDGVLRRADREAIAYDRLNQFEKRFISRAIWFYPWVKGSTVFTVNTALEHPFKAAALGDIGHAGSQQQQDQLGDQPSYEQGLTQLAGGPEPVVSDFNTFNPFSTAADLLQIPSHLGNVAGMANPVYGAALHAAEGSDPYGSSTPTPITDNLKGLLTTTPEYQILAAKLDHADQSHRLFPGGHGNDPLYKNWLGELVRAAGGPAMPRHLNPDAGHSLAERERTGR